MAYNGLPDIDDDDFGFFQKRIFSLSGIHLSTNKKDLVRARLIPRLAELGLDSIHEYRSYLSRLSSQDDEWQLLINQITTNKTDFFREIAHFKFILEKFLPTWVQKNAQDPTQLRAWSAACSTGEEPYTLAMVLERYFGNSKQFEITASDIDTKVLNQAENGVYPLHRLSEIPFEYQPRAITKGQGEVKNWFKIKETIQRSVNFAHVNLVETDFAKLGNFDIIFCRNVFLYFQQETIQDIVAKFAKILKPRGILILGHSESLRLTAGKWTSHGPSVYMKDIATAKAGLHDKVTASRPLPPGSRQLSAAAVPSEKKLSPAKKRVLIVDDSSTIRQLLTLAFGQYEKLEVVGAIGDPREVLEAIRKTKPDVITLDLKMPHMDGCELLELYLPKFPIPTVMISAVNIEDGGQVMRALELGAVDYIQKPTLEDIKIQGSSLAERVYQAVESKVRQRRPRPKSQSRSAAEKKALTALGHHQAIILIGASTGGIQALTEVLTQLPAAIPPILIVQHIPAAFSLAFADRLNQQCSFHVKEAADGDLIQNDLVLIAPGGRHMEIDAGRNGFCVRLTDGPNVNRHKPAVDVLFNSAAKLLGSQAIGVILTGMGSDGAKGLKLMQEKGAKTLAQDEASSAVFGMPREAIRLGAADEVCALEHIPAAIIRLLGAQKTKQRA